jgi:hypothetical protein
VPQWRVELDHLVVLPLDQVQVDRIRQDRRQVGKLTTWLGVGQVSGDRLQPRSQLEAEQLAEGEGRFALAMAVDILALNRHVVAVPQHAPDHGVMVWTAPTASTVPD